jgi:hypothetical protein
MDCLLNHLVCDLDRERRVAEGARRRLIRAVLRGDRGPSRWERIFGVRAPAAPDAGHLIARTEDVWHAFRFDGPR